jgi:uncharacterized protein (DUF1501 family)
VAPASRAVVSRRGLLGGALAAVAWARSGGSALADLALNPGRREPDGDVLVTVFLRGGADGLTLVPPVGEDAYHRRRPNLAVAAPRDRRAAAANRALDLDGFFGLHPALAPLHPLYRDGTLAVVHACGSGDQTRSHFEAMAAMERGLADDRTGTASGWLARHLSSLPPAGGGSASPLRAVAFSGTLPDALRGATNVTTLLSLADFRLQARTVPAPRGEDLLEALGEVYGDGGGDDAAARAGRETIAVLDTLRRIDPARYRPAAGAAYPDSELGNGLRQVACLIKSGVGLEVACLDRGGWDTHVAQSGWIGPQLADVGSSLAAFVRDLGPQAMRRVTVLVMTEFGRRLQENSGLGTDHGRASTLFVIGGGAVGGKVWGQWPGLEDHQLDGPGDLRVTTDYRDVLGEIVRKRLGNRRLDAVFPRHRPHFHGIVRASASDAAVPPPPVL